MPISALGTRVPTFFIRDMPASSDSRPASMNRTSTEHTITQSVLIGTVSPSAPLLAASSESAVAVAGSASPASSAPAPARSSLDFIASSSGTVTLRSLSVRGPGSYLPAVGTVTGDAVRAVEEAPGRRARMAGGTAVPRYTRWSHPGPRGLGARHGMVAAAARAARASPLRHNLERDHEGTTVGQAD